MKMNVRTFGEWMKHGGNRHGGHFVGAEIRADFVVKIPPEHFWDGPGRFWILLEIGQKWSFLRSKSRVLSPFGLILGPYDSPGLHKGASPCVVILCSPHMISSQGDDEFLQVLKGRRAGCHQNKPREPERTM